MSSISLVLSHAFAILTFNRLTILEALSVGSVHHVLQLDGQWWQSFSWITYTASKSDAVVLFPMHGRHCSM